MKLTKMIYIASAYTSSSQAIESRRYINITRVIGQLQDKYSYAFIGPITQSHNTVKFMKNRNTSFNDWARRDLTYISRCDEVWFYLDKSEAWKQSHGMKSELEYCIKNEIPVRFIDYKTLKVK